MKGVSMVSISKINPILNVQNTNKARNIARKIDQTGML